MNYEQYKKLLISFFILCSLVLSNTAKADIVLDTVSTVIVPYIYYHKVNITPGYVSPSALTNWDSLNSFQDRTTSFEVIEYNKCIPKAQCTFDDCGVEGSDDGEGNYCLPAPYSIVADIVPDILGGIDTLAEILGKDVINDEDLQQPVEHAQASLRLPDVGNKAYFMFTTSGDYYGYIWVVEVKGIDPFNPAHMKPDMEANVVWWKRLDECPIGSSFLDAYCFFRGASERGNTGIYNHPARMSRYGTDVAIAFQNYTFFAAVCNLSTELIPSYPAVHCAKSNDALAFFDVSDPRKPILKRRIFVNGHSSKYLDDDIEKSTKTWGENISIAYPFTNSDGGTSYSHILSEVAYTKVGENYHVVVGDGGKRYHFKMKSPDSLVFDNISQFTKSDDSSNFESAVEMGWIVDAMTLIEQPDESLCAARIAVDSRNENGQDGLYLSSYKFSYFGGYEGINCDNLKDDYDPISLYIDDIGEGSYEGFTPYPDSFGSWVSEACDRAWGFQANSNGGYNVICHNIDPKGGGLHSPGQFVVRGVTPGQSIEP